MTIYARINIILLLLLIIIFIIIVFKLTIKLRKIKFKKSFYIKEVNSKKLLYPILVLNIKI